MIAPVFAESRASASPALRVCGSRESERKAGFFVTGWRSRERLSAARRGDCRHG